MNKTISAFDLIKAEPLEGFTQFDAVDLKNLNLVNSVLEELGFDIDKPIFIEAHNHRTLTGDVRVGYVFKGSISRKREHVYGKYSTIHDMFAFAEGEGQDWYDELLAMQSHSVAYGADSALDDKIPMKEDAEYKAEENKIVSEIALLEGLLKIARGDQRKACGSMKTAHDYKNPEVAEKQKGRRRSRKNQQGNVNE